ncbi:DNA polymerase III subunit alpha [Peribacillus sp. FSL H8-0477]|uniref:DNA polymerase III subunit alpha n=1 Tax=Peribacillus sp. FSL H8-0477 TaxID=2921388 RepID=UPI0030F6F1F4
MFIHLHIQSAYSLLSSTVKINELVTKAKQQGYSSLALTDRNVMYGSLYFYKECRKQGIKPIIGLLADILDEEDQAYSLLLLAENNEGYQNLLKISSAIKTKSPLGLPLKWLKHYSAGLIAVSPGSEGKIETLIREGNILEAQKTLAGYTGIFGKHSFFMSLQRQAGNEEWFTEVKDFAKENGIELTATNPVFYLEKDDALSHEVILAVKNGNKLADEERERMDAPEHYLKSEDEMIRIFEDCPDALENTMRIAARCEVEIAFNRPLLPKYPVEEGTSASAMLERLCLEALTKKTDATEDYKDRLNYELTIINKMGFSDYFLIVWDFMKYARENGIRTGPGRGSAAGSMVAYVLSITDVDPIAHHLLFERFLNPERVTMPDIDIDFPDNRRDEVIDYVAQKYGELHVAQILTFGTMAAKAALRDTGRAFGLNAKELDRLSKMIPGRLGITLKEAFKESKQLRSFVEESGLNQSLFDTALKLEGLPRHTSTHAAGIIISDQPLTELIAIQGGHEGVHLTQFPMDLLEELGLLKMDFLGLRNLTLIENIVVSVQKETGRKLDLSTIPLDDEASFELLAKGETTGIFQFESTGITNVLMKLRPTRFEDIVAVNALYRPGPMENIPLFIERKHGITPIDYPHPDLEEILKDTYGVIVYQEQIMQIASKLAGFSLGEADLLRRAVSKKKKDILDQERKHFTSGAVSQGYTEQTANAIYDMVVRFANYGFNRSHAVAYSFIAYQLTYLKARFPQHFYACLLTSAIGNDVKIAQYVQESKKHGIEILPPSINMSQFPFQVEKAGIRFSLAAIKGIGGTVLKEIFAARRVKRFDDLFDFCIRVSAKIVNRKILESLVHSGAFDEFNVDRATLLASLDVAISHAELVSPGDNQFDLFEHSDFSLKPKYNEVDPIRSEDKLFFEKNVLGFYLSAHPAAGYRKIFQHFGAVTIDTALERSEKRILLGVYVSTVKSIRTKKGEVMAFFTISDEGGDMEAVAFPEQYKQTAAELKAGNILMIQGNLEERDGKRQLIIKDVYSLESCMEMVKDSGRLFIKIEAAKQTNKSLQQIKSLLVKYKGMTKVMLYYASEERYIQLPLWDWVAPSQALLQQLEEIVGSGNIVLKTE